jgi:hypothetical protein
VQPGRAFIAGIAGALVMSLIMVWLRAVGVPLHIELQLAAALGTRVWAVGFAAHLLIGGVLGLAYAMVFDLVLQRAGVGPGLLLGALNTILAGFVWTKIGGQGRFWSGLGPEGIAALFLLHLAYGAVVGGLYRSEHTMAYH